jgi:two-component system CheB/CheR fusion protein
LIGVTSFFRDPDAFEALGAHLGELIDSAGRDRGLRVWVPGCSTGEEAYSIAILLCEHMERSGHSIEAQVFATDIDPDAIEVARKGCYPVGIAHHVTPERLTRFFTIAEDMFRIKKEVRELVVFSTQNLISDPPFIKLDLLSCRNLLIYFDASIQQRLLPMFQYALRPGGLLFLGSSESVGSTVPTFEIVDKKWKLFRRAAAADGQYVSAPSMPGAYGHSAGQISVTPTIRQSLAQPPPIERMLLHELVPPTVIVNERGDVVHVHGRTGQFLEPAPGGQQSVSIYDMAREGLRLELSAAVRQVIAQPEPELIRRDVHVGSNGGTLLVDLRVKRVRDLDRLRNLVLITFERARPWVQGVESSSADEVGSRHDRMLDLERELQHTKESHQGTIEELETSNEELKSTNEELQSTNEELQSANEELETSKEEMQSLNEELQTVNAELQGKIEELSRANDDMKNLLNGTDIATVFLDNELNIKRYTEQARHVIRLIHSDVGRPIGDLVSRLRYDRLVEDAHEVLRTLVFKETEVRAQDGGWYLMRILPYRTIENMIDGLVITFVDITKFKALQNSEARLTEQLRNSPTAILGQDRELRYTWVSGTVLGRKVTVGQSDADLFPAGEAEQLIALKRSVLETGAPRRETVKLTVDGGERSFDIYLQPLRSDGEKATELASIVTDVTTRTYEP